MRQFNWDEIQEMDEFDNPTPGAYVAKICNVGILRTRNISGSNGTLQREPTRTTTRRPMTGPGSGPLY